MLPWTSALLLASCAVSPDEPGEPAEPPPPIVDVLWELDLPEGSYGRLLGVDEGQNRAWFSVDDSRSLPERPEQGWTITEVDLGRREVVAVWGGRVGTADRARRREFGRLWPLVDDSEDLARLTEVVLATRTSPRRGAKYLLEPSPAGDLLVHHRMGDGAFQGDWLTLRRRDGTRLRRVAEGRQAAYLASFSADGGMLAYTACGEGDRGPCDYGVFVEDLGGKVRQVPGLGHLMGLDWAADGALLALDDGGTSSACVWRVELGDLRPTRLLCGDGLRNVHFRVSDSGGRGVLWGMRGKPGKQDLELTWFATDTGLVTHRDAVALGVGVEDLREDGVVLVDARGLVVLDPERGRRARLEGFWADGGVASWSPRGLLLTRRSPRDRRLELVRLDVDALLAGDGS